MSSQRLIRATENEGLQPSLLDGSPIVLRWRELFDFFDRAGRPELKRFFAEPVYSSRHEGMPKRVSWYTAVQGEPVGLDQLTGGDREAAESLLRDQLESLRPLLEDPRGGALLYAALAVPDFSDVFLVFGQAVLTNWGYLPQTVSDEESRAQHWMSTFGRLVPFIPEAPPPTVAPASPELPQETPMEHAAVRVPGLALDSPGEKSGSSFPGRSMPVDRGLGGDGGDADDGSPVRRLTSARGKGAAFQGAAAQPSPPVEGEGVQAVVYPQTVVSPVLIPWYQRPGVWAVCTLALLLVGVFLGYLLWPGLKRTPAPSDLSRMIAMQEAVNQGLEDQIKKLREAFTGDVCAIDDPLLTGPLRNQPVAPSGQPPLVQPPAAGSPPNVASPPAQGSNSLAEVLERGAVLVLNPTGRSTGSGFFVAPDIVVTNHHVVDGGDPQKMLVTSKGLGHVMAAKVLAATDANNRDYAILKVEGSAESNIVTLATTGVANKLEGVVAAGYPGIVTESDPSYARLVNGDASAIPSLHLTEGTISAIFDETPAKLIHTALISQGNSGGPLVDRCARVVGINTLIKVGENNLHQVNIALSSADLTAYLKENGVPVNEDNTPCQPRPPADPATPPASAAPPSTEGGNNG